ncbi:MAG TPA: hypothetical protein VK540_00490 [Polyangiaceae bacterium]|nr:hypothetical protein [Polyangiaceae bacterium]
MHLHRAAPSVCYFLLATLSACSSQVEPTYTGEPLGSMEGTIVDPVAPVDGTATSAVDVPTVATLPEGAVVAVYWLPGFGDYYSGSAIVHAGGEIPRFKLNFFEPPPDAALRVDSDGEMAVAYGQLVLLAPGTQIGKPYNKPEMQSIWGYSLDSMILYFARDPRPRIELLPDVIEDAGRFYGVPAKRGYHVVRMTLGDRAERDLCNWGGRGRCENRATCGENSRVKLGAHRLDFDLCQKAMPDAPTCWTCSIHESEPQCSRGGVTPDCGDFWTFEPNPDDAPIPVTITLGATYRDFAL